jgi:hypothetical protein
LDASLPFVEEHFRQRNPEGDGLLRTLFHAAVAVEAKLRITDNGRLSGLRSKEYIFCAYIHTGATLDTG